jgi:hypothetical protein
MLLAVLAVTLSFLPVPDFDPYDISMIVSLCIPITHDADESITAIYPEI